MSEDERSILKTLAIREREYGNIWISGRNAANLRDGITNSSELIRTPIETGDMILVIICEINM